jgi:hypothetical protein
MEPLEQHGKLLALGAGETFQETVLLPVQDAHGFGLGGTAGSGGMDQKSPPVAGMTLPFHVTPVFEIIEQRHHGVGAENLIHVTRSGDTR